VSHAPAVRLILASASPARRATLLAAGIEPTVHVSAVDEPELVSRYGVTAAEDIALLLARAKAEDVAAQLGEPHEAVVVGCDSVLELAGSVHGKPDDAEQARELWQRMRGSSGTLFTGHWVIDLRENGSKGTLGAVAGTVVHFAEPSDDEIDAYIATGEPLAVAGAFTVDGLGGAFVRGIEGDHHNVVGISLPVLRELLAECGIPWHSLWTR
jgi:septum formation protein